MMLRPRSALVKVALAVVLLAAPAVTRPTPAQAAPATPAFGPSIDPFADYVGQTTCDPTAKPGAIGLRDLLEATYPVTYSLGIVRDCAVGGQSEHKEGRAYDWAVSSFDPAQKAMADDTLAWLMATDQYGNVNAMARRLGIMYMIWNRQVWKAYGTNRGWQAYTGSNPHTDHVHFSLSWDGAYKRTSWWNPPTPTIPAAGVAFHPVAPTRILDSRPGAQVGPYGTPWASGQVRDVTVNGAAGVPFDAGAVVLNATVTGTTGSGFLTLWPTGQPQPNASSINWTPGQTVANAVTVRVGSGGRVSVASSSGTTHLLLDVVGYYDARPGDGFTPLPPARVLDSRAGAQVGPYATPWGPGQSRPVKVAGLGGVPTGADAVVANVTATSTTAAGFLTIWPAGQSRPTTSSVNWGLGQTIANAVTMKVGADGQVSVYNDAGSTEVIIDVLGYFAAGSGYLFHPLPPARIQDSRVGGPLLGAWGAGVAQDVQVTGRGGGPAGAAAVSSNVTVTGTTAWSFLTVWPAGLARPSTSSLNWTPAQTVPNAVSSKLGSSGAVTVRNDAGTAHVIVDVGGWFG